MIQKVKSISALMIFSVLFFQMGFSQQLDEKLAQTVIFKIKQEYRVNCSATQIAIPQFNALLSSI